MAFGNAGPSVIFTSMDFHWAPNAAMPSAVSRSTTWAGGSCGAICGGDVGGSGWAETAIRDAVASTAPATSVARLLWRMVVLPRCATLLSQCHFACSKPPALQRVAIAGDVSAVMKARACVGSLLLTGIAL